VLHIGNEGGISRLRQRVERKVVGVFKALVRDFFVVIGVFGHDADQQLV
jgi:hypothetical protein